MTHFHKSTASSNSERKAEVKKAISQETIVLAIFSTESRWLTANDILDNWHRYDQQRKPLLTSVRRAISNLQAAGKLEKTTQMRRGPYGVNVHYYRMLATEPGQQLDLF